MLRKERSKYSGLSLLAMALVFTVGIVVRSTQGESAGALLPLAVLFGVLGVSQFLLGRRASGRAGENGES